MLPNPSVEEDIPKRCECYWWPWRIDSLGRENCVCPTEDDWNLDEH